MLREIHHRYEYDVAQSVITIKPSAMLVIKRLPDDAHICGYPHKTLQAYIKWWSSYKADRHFDEIFILNI